MEGYPSVRLPCLTTILDSDAQNLAEEGKKGGNSGDRGHNCEESREKEKDSLEKGSGYTSLLK